LFNLVGYICVFTVRARYNLQRPVENVFALHFARRDIARLLEHAEALRAKSGCSACVVLPLRARASWTKM
jgi:hypothetical protein